MTEEKTDKQPEGPGGVGKEKDESADAEAGGRGKRTVLYTCFRDGAQNWVDPDWTWFTCWRCGVVTYL
jgi:hypothetical protein